MLDFGRFPGRWEITRSTEEMQGELLETRFHIETATGDAPPLQIHPYAEERYEVLSGVLEVNVEGEWKQVSTGETHRVPAGTAHTFRNRVPVELINVRRPALEFERFFRRFHQLDRPAGLPHCWLWLRSSPSGRGIGSSCVRDGRSVSFQD